MGRGVPVPATPQSHCTTEGIPGASPSANPLQQQQHSRTQCSGRAGPVATPCTTRAGPAGPFLLWGFLAMLMHQGTFCVPLRRLQRFLASLL